MGIQVSNSDSDSRLTWLDLLMSTCSKKGIALDGTLQVLGRYCVPVLCDGPAYASSPC